jgi:hypothetical protein
VLCGALELASRNITAGAVRIGYSGLGFHGDSARSDSRADPAVQVSFIRCSSVSVYRSARSCTSRSQAMRLSARAIILANRLMLASHGTERLRRSIGVGRPSLTK